MSCYRTHDHLQRSVDPSRVYSDTCSVFSSVKYIMLMHRERFIFGRVYGVISSVKYLIRIHRLYVVPGSQGVR